MCFQAALFGYSVKLPLNHDKITRFCVSGSLKMKLNHPIGQAAEDRAWAFLQAQGCELVARNWHCPHGEIDLIVKLANTLIFVEVKYRKSQSFGGAAYSITSSKLAKLQRSVAYYLQINSLNIPCRLDAVLLQGNTPPNWIKNITG